MKSNMCCCFFQDLTVAFAIFHDFLMMLEAQYIATVACEKLETLFFLDYSANMYSRKTKKCKCTGGLKNWNVTQVNRNALPEVSVFYAEDWASYPRKTGV